jgi:glycosyltransferase involved in cell wall biosynthesis
METKVTIFTWHIHGSYLFYLSRNKLFEIYIPVNNEQTTGYIGRGSTFPFGPNVKEVHVSEIPNHEFDCILFQTPSQYLVDQYRIFSKKQLGLPKIYLEHDPPQEVPTDTRHVVRDPAVTVVHVTHFNRLMWDNGSAPTIVIDHGVDIPPLEYTGRLARGVVVINNLDERGRRLGLDIFQKVRKVVPIDLIGMGAEKLGGNGEILHPQLPESVRHYRFFFNPIRYTSLGLAVLEAMMLGVPVVGLATTELVTVIENGKSGIIHTDVEYLIDRMRDLLTDADRARALGAEGKRVVKTRFNIERFCTQWYETVLEVMNKKFEEVAA